MSHETPSPGTREAAEALDKAAFAYAVGIDRSEPCTTVQRDLFNAFLAGHAHAQGEIKRLGDYIDLQAKTYSELHSGYKDAVKLTAELSALKSRCEVLERALERAKEWIGECEPAEKADAFLMRLSKFEKGGANE